MIWNSRVNSRAPTRVIAVLLASALPAACVAPPASDTPAPSLVAEPVVAPAIAVPVRVVAESERIRIARVEIGAAKSDEPLVRRIVHPKYRKGLRDPVLIQAQLVRPLGDLARAASPVIVFNGRPLTNSIVVGERADRVVAVLPNRKQLLRVNRVQVGWFGDLERSLSEPIDVVFNR